MALKDIRLKSAPPTTSGEQLFFLARSDTEYKKIFHDDTIRLDTSLITHP